MWCDGYGYASGINETMRTHLEEIVSSLRQDTLGRRVVLDIGCNDGTLLKSWPESTFRIGFDPVAKPISGMNIVSEYFSAKRYRELGFPKADIVTSIAMFYDLDDPVKFAEDVVSILAPDGIWCLEVGYVGALLDGAWDGICHEHVNYFGLKQIRDIAERVGLGILRFEFNKMNGGSLQVRLTRGADSHHADMTIAKEKAFFNFSTFEREVQLEAKAIRRCITEDFKGKKIYALGASTKGNIILQTAWLDSTAIQAAVDRNPDKVGRRLPGTRIPIISEEEARANPPDAFLVLPWHFKDQLLEREKELRSRGVKFIFPLPTLEVC
jgi:hypothetical protein